MPQHSPLFPYTTLFRSKKPGAMIVASANVVGAGGASSNVPCAVVRTVVARPFDVNVSSAPSTPSPVDQLITRPLSTPPSDATRSEEHTSELQSPCNLVCRSTLHSFPTRRSSDLRSPVQ